MKRKRILSLLKKDLKENWIIFIVFLSIPLLVYYIYPIIGSEEIVVGVYGESPENFPFVIVKYRNIEDGILAVKNEDICSFYVSEQRILYGLRENSEKIEIIASFFSPNCDIAEISLNSLNPNYLLLPVLLSMIILMGGFIGGAIVMGSEKSERTLEALLLTPLTHREFVVEKTIISFISTFLSSVIFLFISKGIIGNVIGTIVILILSAFLFSLISLIITAPFSTMEAIIAIITPVLIVIIFFESISMLNTYSLPLPVSRGLYKSIILNEFPFTESLILLIFIFIFIYISKNLYKRIYNKK
ncbi:hypothetical protein DRN58_01755 [Thermococci archaeon]|nr:MAG: hypothetical protein DRN58_01755 [Thermococci archaeon]